MKNGGSPMDASSHSAVRTLTVSLPTMGGEMSWQEETRQFFSGETEQEERPINNHGWGRATKQMADP